MPIDWFTVVAQVLNFLVLVWLLQRFLYRPILDAIDSREARIAEELAEAATRTTEAGEERARFEQKHRVFDAERAALRNEAIETAREEGARELAALRSAAETARAQWQAALCEQADQLATMLQSRTQAELFAIAHKIMRELADTTLEAQMVSVFIQRLQDMDDAARHSFSEALSSASEPATLYSAFTLAEPLRATIHTALRSCFGKEMPLRFESGPELISGIALSTQGQRIEWSITSHLRALQQRVEAALKASNVPIHSNSNSISNKATAVSVAQP